MRQRSTRERRMIRIEFIYKYRGEISLLEKLSEHKWVRDTPEIKEFVEKTARIELEYSIRTYYFDIWMSLVKDKKRIIF